MEQAVIHSPLGPLTLFAEDDHLTALVYGDYGLSLIHISEPTRH